MLEYRGRNGNDGYVANMLDIGFSDECNRFKSAHDRHMGIHENYVKFFSFDRFYSNQSIFDYGHIAVPSAQNVAEGEAVEVVVLRHQYFECVEFGQLVISYRSIGLRRRGGYNFCHDRRK